MSLRIHQAFEISFDEMKDIFARSMDLELIATDFMSDGGSTSNYRAETAKGNFLLKLYPPHRDNQSEISLMKELEGEINIPKIHVYDNSRTIVATDFMIADFIEGETFREHVTKHGISRKHAKCIGETLSVIHGKDYEAPHYFDQSKSPVMSIREQYDYFLQSPAGQHLGDEHCQYMRDLASRYQKELAFVNERVVRTHGDLNPGNILVDEQGELWFIDFEYGHATTPYLDFGKFLRKRENFSKYLDKETLEAVKEGYQHPLADNWVHLSMLVDLPGMLRLINTETTNMWRVGYIKNRIKDLHEDLDLKTYRYVADAYVK